MPKIDALLFAFTGQLMLAGRQWRQISQAAVTAHGISAAAAAPPLVKKAAANSGRTDTRVPKLTHPCVNADDSSAR